MINVTTPQKGTHTTEIQNNTVQYFYMLLFFHLFTCALTKHLPTKTSPKPLLQFFACPSKGETEHGHQHGHPKPLLYDFSSHDEIVRKEEGNGASVVLFFFLTGGRRFAWTTGSSDASASLSLYNLEKVGKKAPPVPYKYSFTSFRVHKLKSKMSYV